MIIGKKQNGEKYALNDTPINGRFFVKKGFDDNRWINRAFNTFQEARMQIFESTL
jgi:hypothetical protein